MILAAGLGCYAAAFDTPFHLEWWLVVHVTTLGVLTNAILQWSWYFSRSLLRLPADDKHSGVHQTIRQLSFNLFFVVLIAAMLSGRTNLAVGAAVAIGAVIAWHTAALTLAARTSLGARFAVIIRYYVLASLFLLLGVVFGVLVTIPLLGGSVPEPLGSKLAEAQGGSTLAHALVNGLGWLGLTIAGTLVTLGPTVLRTRMDEGAVTAAVRVLPFLGASLLVAAGAAVAGALPLAGAAVLLYVAALTWGVGAPLWRVARSRPLADYASWNLAAGIIWALLGLAGLGIALLSSADTASFRRFAMALVVVIGAGGAAQILIGALTYLLPVVVGGGPRPVKAGNAALQIGGGARLAIRSAALILLVPALGLPLWQGLWGALLAATFMVDIGMFAFAGVRQARLKRTNALERKGNFQ